MAESTSVSVSREAILDAAEALFAQQGFNATTVKQIARAAGVNVALLYYYFGDKEALYHAVLERVISAFVTRAAAAFAASPAPVDAVAALVAIQARALREHPTMARLMARELIDHQARHAKPQISYLAANLFKRLCDTIQHGQRDGSFRDDLNPRFAAISCIAQIAYFNLARPAVGILLGEDPSDAMYDQFAAHAAAFALSALETRDASALPQADGA